MIKTTAMLCAELKDYEMPLAKISRMMKDGEIIQIVRGLYETDRSVPGYLLAGSIYGPSYLSFEFALSYHGMIPEAVYTFTSATCSKRKSKKYETPFGVFTYKDIPVEAYPFGVELKEENGYYYSIATPEKSLCDMLHSVKKMNNRKEIISLLFDDLRIDEEKLLSLNIEDIGQYAELYRNANIDKLYRYLRGLKK